MSRAASYLDGWIRRLDEPRKARWIIEAAGKAQKAADWILGAQPQ
jgi:antirestriction protein ArdC